MHTYELRTVRGTRVMAFDNESRAKEYQATHSKRVGIKLELWRTKLTEERVA